MRETLIEFLYKIREFLISKFNQYDKKLPYILTIIIALVIVVVGINLFIELTDTLKTKVLVTYDKQITEFIISYRNPGLTNYFEFMTNVGDLYGYIIALGICAVVFFFVFKNWKFVFQIILVLLLASVSNVFLKKFVNRARPSIEHLVSVQTLSYPSGHAMSAMAFYGFLIYLIYTFPIHRLIKIFTIIILVILILSIGISRIYLGVHFPSDIAGGYIAGFIWVVLCILIFHVIDLFRRDPNT